MVHEILTGTERARLQTVEEWLLENKTGSPVMAFIDTKTGREVDSFFNVDIKKNTGNIKENPIEKRSGG